LCKINSANEIALKLTSGTCVCGARVVDEIRAKLARVHWSLERKPRVW